MMDKTIKFIISTLYMKSLVTLLTISENSAENHNRLIFPKLPNYVENSRNDTCNMESNLYQASLKNYTYWAYEMLDSSAKYTHGLLRGNVQELGDFYQCISIEAPFKTQYCVAKVTATVPQPSPKRDPFSLKYNPYESAFNRIYKTNDVSQLNRDVVQLALCLPASCSPKELEDFLNHFLQVSPKPANVTYEVKVLPELCQQQNTGKSFDEVDISFCVVVLLIFLSVTYCTALDYRQSENSPTTQSYCLALSLKRNFKELIRKPKSDSPLTILNGMRTFSICVIIIMHRFTWSSISYLKDFDYIEREYRSPYSTFFFRAELFVDSFFIFSGILMAYRLLSIKAINPLLIISIRYLRLTPAYALALLYYSSVFYYTGSGPFWNLFLNFEIHKCRKNWWTNLLYISNYVDTRNICMPISWYLSCDFHFFIIGIIIILAIKKHKRFGLVLLTLALLISTIIPFVITLVQEHPAILKLYRAELMSESSSPYFFDVYIASHTRASPYIVGIVTGYIYHNLERHPNKRLSETISYVVTITSIAVAALTMFSGSVFFDPYHKYNALEAAAYAGFHRLPWSFSTTGLMIALSFGPNSFLKRALSLNIWSVFAKLSYSAYLLHIMFDLRSFASVSTSNSSNYLDLIHLSLADVTATFLLSLILYLGLEAPITTLSKMFLLKSKKEMVTNEMDNIPRNAESALGSRSKLMPIQKPQNSEVLITET